MIEIVPYDEHWPAEFAAIAGCLRRALGDMALRIDHIGSTSVPGLPAKDIVDVQVTVAALEPDERLRAALGSIGYTLREGVTCDHRPPNVVGPDAEWEKRFFKPPPEQRPTNLHVRAAGRANQRYALLFRDYLRSHPPAAAAYAELKRRLAHYLVDDLKTYAEIKDPVCDVIMGAAEEWAAATGWQSALSDA
jgi:GrpB-like predicted nucleotidyltransferase (UPF0157 family)